jgi:hypothetical protein
MNRRTAFYSELLGALPKPLTVAPIQIADLLSSSCTKHKGSLPHRLFLIALIMLVPQEVHAQFRLGHYLDGTSTLDVTPIPKPGSENMKLKGVFTTITGCSGAWYQEYDYGVAANYLGLPIKQQAYSVGSGTILCGGTQLNLIGPMPPQSAAFIQPNQNEIIVSAHELGGTYTFTSQVSKLPTRLPYFDNRWDIRVRYTVKRPGHRRHTAVGTPREIMKLYSK